MPVQEVVGCGDELEVHGLDFGARILLGQHARHVGAPLGKHLAAAKASAAQCGARNVSTTHVVPDFAIRRLVDALREVRQLFQEGLLVLAARRDATACHDKPKAENQKTLQ